MPSNDTPNSTGRHRLAQIKSLSISLGLDILQPERFAPRHIDNWFGHFLHEPIVQPIQLPMINRLDRLILMTGTKNPWVKFRNRRLQWHRPTMNKQHIDVTMLFHSIDPTVVLLIPLIAGMGDRIQRARKRPRRVLLYFVFQFYVSDVSFKTKASKCQSIGKVYTSPDVTLSV